MPLTIEFKVEAYGALDFKRSLAWKSVYTGTDNVTVAKIHEEILSMTKSVTDFVTLEQEAGGEV